MALVEAENVTKFFRIQVGARLRGQSARLRAVDGVSLSIDAGETLGLVGESGCGKTTIGRCLVGLEQPSSGAVRFDGERVDHLSSSASRRLCRQRQIVFQDPYASLDPRWRVGDIIDEPLRIHGIVPPGERAAEAERLLGEVGLASDARSHYPHEFSGGQRQRIGIARALSVRPRFVVADEPVSALDVSIRAQILNLLSAAQRERGLAMLFITHDLGAVRQISHRIAVMYLGAVVETASTEEIFTNPRHPYTRKLLRAAPRIAGRRLRAAGPATGDDVPLALEIGQGCRYRTRCPLADAVCEEYSPELAPSPGSPEHFAACHRRMELSPFDPDDLGERADLP